MGHICLAHELNNFIFILKHTFSVLQYYSITVSQGEMQA